LLLFNTHNCLKNADGQIWCNGSLESKEESQGFGIVFSYGITSVTLCSDIHTNSR